MFIEHKLLMDMMLHEKIILTEIFKAREKFARFLVSNVIIQYSCKSLKALTFIE